MSEITYKEYADLPIGSLIKHGDESCLLLEIRKGCDALNEYPIRYLVYNRNRRKLEDLDADWFELDIQYKDEELPFV